MRFLDRLPRPVERQWWRAMAALEPFDPAPAVATARFKDPPPFALLAVYRYENAANVVALCAEAVAGGVIRLWALDRTHPDLERWTVGEGPGLRSPLLNRLYGAVPASFDGFVVLSDDDYVFTKGSLRTFLAVTRAGEFGIAQPGHDRMSNISHWVTAGRRLSLARLTTFVEIGPVVAVSPRWREYVLPLADSAMGWGLDLVWSDLRQQGCRHGIVDACLINHLYPVRGGATYDVAAGIVEMEPLYAARGGYPEALRTIATWWPWSRHAPRSPTPAR